VIPAGTGPEADRRPELVVNGERCVVPTSTTVEGLVALVGIERRGVAVAVDGQVVPRSAWSEVTLVDGARVEIVTAAAGG
jgi:sulfur carrier protein